MEHSPENTGRRQSMLAAALAAAIWALHAGLSTRYYDFDSVPMIITDRSSFNPAHFGYQELMLGFSQLYRLIGIEYLSRYHFLQIVQAGLAAVVLGLIVYTLAREGGSIGFAAAVTVFLAMSGASVRMTTMLEDDVLTPLLIIIGIILAERKPGSHTIRYLAPAFFWLGAMSFDMVAASATGPLFLLLFYRMFRERRIAHCAVVFLMGVALGALFLAVHSNTQDSYNSMRWGGHYLTAANLSAFAVSGGRLLLYLVGPSMDLLQGLPARAFAGVAVLLSAVFCAALAAWAAAAVKSRRERRGLAAAILAGAAIRVVFAFWWMPWNSEQLITPWFLTVFTAGFLAADSADRTALRRRASWAAAAAAVMLAANLHFVALPSHRYEFPLIEAVREAAGSVPGGKVAAIITDAQDLATFYRYREAFVPPARQGRYPEIALYYAAIGIHCLPTLEESTRFEQAVTSLAGQLIARHGRAFLLIAEEKYAGSRIETDSNKRDLEAEAGLASMSLAAVVSRHFHLAPGAGSRGYRLYIVTRRMNAGDQTDE